MESEGFLTRPFPERLQETECPDVTLALEVLVEDVCEYGSRLSHRIKQRHGGSEFQIIRMPKDLRNGSPVDGKRQFRTVGEPRAEDRMS